MDDVVIFWFRRDLRLHDNIGLNNALKSGIPVLPLFIFDTTILDELEKNDARVQFIQNQLVELNNQLKEFNSSILIDYGNPLEVWEKIVSNYNIKGVFANKDYEPYGINRDCSIKEFLQHHHIKLNTYKDHVIFEELEIVKNDGLPYTVYTPYKNKWLEKLNTNYFVIDKSLNTNYYQSSFDIPSLEEIGFKSTPIKVKPINLSLLSTYQATRDYPFKNSSSNLGPHLRFGTVSIRQMVDIAIKESQTFLNELIWREFFIQILFNYPNVVTRSFKKNYDQINWRNNQKEFDQWCNGQTGYPMVDAGMNELNETGYMHNRVRMVVASFLCKHLLIDWRWGEAYFAKKLLDYELSSNNGNWQWAAGTGCDAAPYFRVFNPTIQQQKFDPDFTYIRKWVPDYKELNFILPIVEHNFARDRAIKTYKEGLGK